MDRYLVDPGARPLLVLFRRHPGTDRHAPNIILLTTVLVAAGSAVANTLYDAEHGRTRVAHGRL